METFIDTGVTDNHPPIRSHLGSRAISVQVNIVARLPVIRALAFSMIPNTLPASAWAKSNHGQTSTKVACQRLLLQVELRLRITMQHIHSHAQNLGNECADHAAALGTSNYYTSNAAEIRCKTCEQMDTSKNWMNYYSITTMRIGCEINIAPEESCISISIST